jgi:hypothetical protein
VEVAQGRGEEAKARERAVLGEGGLWTWTDGGIYRTEYSTDGGESLPLAHLPCTPSRLVQRGLGGRELAFQTVMMSAVTCVPYPFLHC